MVFILLKKKKKKQKYELYHLGLMSRHFGPLSLVKTRREGKGKGGREGGGKEREKGKKIQEVTWFVREKWREI